MHALALTLGLAGLVSSVPVAERQLGLNLGVGGGSAPAHNWACKYTGPVVAGVNTGLDVPGLAAGLCLKVGYNYPGCEHFKPGPIKVIKPTHLPTGTHKPTHKPTTTRKPTTTHKPTTAHPTHTHKPPSCGNAQIFSPLLKACINIKTNTAASTAGSCPGGSRLDPALKLCVSVNVLPQPQTKVSTNHGCPAKQVWSGLASACVNVDILSKPVSGATGCGSNRRFDSLLGLCLDLSVLGQSAPKVKTVTKPTVPNPPVTQCANGQRYSSLVKACVNVSALSAPLAGNKCNGNDRFDALLGLCLDAKVAALAAPIVHSSSTTSPTSAAQCQPGTVYSHLAKACLALSSVHQANFPNGPQGAPCPGACQYDPTSKICVETAAIQALLKARLGVGKRAFVNLDANVAGLADADVEVLRP